VLGISAGDDALEARAAADPTASGRDPDDVCAAAAGARGETGGGGVDPDSAVAPISGAAAACKTLSDTGGATGRLGEVVSAGALTTVGLACGGDGGAARAAAEATTDGSGASELKATASTALGTGPGGAVEAATVGVPAAATALKTPTSSGPAEARVACGADPVVASDGEGATWLGANWTGPTCPGPT
jgi:hypothetical protein